MNPKLLTLIETMLGLLLQYAPALAADIAMAIDLIKRKGDLTPAEQAGIDAALATAHKALQDAITAAKP